MRCDETVPFGSWATVVDTLRQAGIQNVSVVTQPLTERPQSSIKCHAVADNSNRQ